MNDAKLIKRLLAVRKNNPFAGHADLCDEAAARISSLTADVKMPEEPLFIRNYRELSGRKTIALNEGLGYIDTLRFALTSALAQLSDAKLLAKKLDTLYVDMTARQVFYKNKAEQFEQQWSLCSQTCAKLQDRAEAAESRVAVSEEQIEEIAITHAEQWWLKQNNGEFPNLNFAIADAVAEALSIASRKSS